MKKNLKRSAKKQKKRNKKRSITKNCIKFYNKISGLVTGNYHYRKLPLPHDIFITATITGTLNFILTVTINLPI